MPLFRELIENFDPSVLGNHELVVQVLDTHYLRAEKSDLSANKVCVAILGAKRGLKELPALPWPGVILLEEGKLWIAQEELPYFSREGTMRMGNSQGCRFVRADDAGDIMRRDILFRRPHKVIDTLKIGPTLYDICDENPVVIYSGGAYAGGGQGRIVMWTAATPHDIKKLTSVGLIITNSLGVSMKALDASEKKEIYRVPGSEHNGDFQLGASCVDGNDLYVTIYELNPKPTRNDAVPLMRLNLRNPLKLENICYLITGTCKEKKPEGVEHMRVRNNRVYFVPYGSPDRLLVQELGGKAPQVVLEAKGLNSIDDFAVYQKGEINL